MEVSQKTKNRTVIQPSNSTPGYTFEENENTNLKRNMQPSVHISIKQSKCTSTDEWKKKSHTHTSHKKKGILLFADTWMEPEGILLSEISQTEVDKYCMLSLTCRIQKVKQTNKCNNTKTDAQIQRITPGEREEKMSRTEV